MVAMRSRRPSVDPTIPPEKAAAAIGGSKTIGLIGGVALLINNITGSGMVLFPSLYQQAGWFVVTIALLAIAFLSYLCSIFIIEAMAAMPGNHTFTKRVEYTSLAYYYLGKYGYYTTQFFFQFSLAFNNMSGIIQSVQVVDFAIAAIFGKSCAVPEFYPSFSFHCPEPVSHDITVFGDIYLLSIGFIVTALLCIPCGFFNLDDNIIIQKISCSVVIGMVLTWAGLFIHWGLEPERVAVIGSQFSQVLGVVVFNFAIISSIPSWVNEKKDNVSILGTMGIAMPIALLLFSIIGIFGGLAFEPWFNTDDSDETLLNKLQYSANTLARITFYLFPVVVNLTSIPVFAIMQRYNLLEAKVCGPRMANFLGVILPWLICIPFYTGSGFSNIVNWGGIIFNSTVNFIIPPLIYISMVRKQAAREAVLAGRLGMHIMPSPPKSHHSDDEEDEGRYVPPGSSASNNGGVDTNPKHTTTTILVSKNTINATGSSSSNMDSLLGPRNVRGGGGGVDDHAASLKQGLLSGDSSYHTESGAYHPSDVDIRSEHDELRDTEILGYDPVEAEQKELEDAEQVAHALEQQHHQQQHQQQQLQMSRSASSNHLAVPGLMDLSRLTNNSPPMLDDPLAHQDSHLAQMTESESSAYFTHSLGWRAMPAWIRPYRIKLAMAVAIVLGNCALIVIGLNIQQCVTSGC